MIFFLVATVALAKPLKPTAVMMQDTLNSFVKLLPYTSNEMKFTDPKNEKEIKRNLELFYHNFSQTKHSKDIRKQTLQPSFKVLSEQIEDALINFRSGNKAFARLRLNEAGYLCLSCHTQFSKDKVKTQITNDRLIQQAFKDDLYAKANLQFILRDYQDALKTYQSVISDKIVRNLEKSKSNKYLLPKRQFFDRQLYGALHNSLLIYTKVYSDPAAAIKLLNGYKVSYNLPNYALEDINSWIKQLKEWEDDAKAIQEKEISQATIDKIIKRLEKKYKKKDNSPLSGDFDIDLMLMSGALSKYYLAQPKKTKKGDVLYWMALLEYRIGKNMFFSLGDHYLKECINTYSKSKVAEKCYNTYREEVEFRYTGSSGSFIPEHVKKELEDLAKKL